MARSGMIGDLRLALRGLARNRAFTVATVLTLALGIGATTAVFTLVDGVLIRPLPFRESERLTSLRHIAVTVRTNCRCPRACTCCTASA